MARPPKRSTASNPSKTQLAPVEQQNSDTTKKATTTITTSSQVLQPPAVITRFVHLSSSTAHNTNSNFHVITVAPLPPSPPHTPNLNSSSQAQQPSAVITSSSEALQPSAVINSTSTSNLSNITSLNTPPQSPSLTINSRNQSPASTQSESTTSQSDIGSPPVSSDPPTPVTRHGSEIVREAQKSYDEISLSKEGYLPIKFTFIDQADITHSFAKEQGQSLTPAPDNVPIPPVTDLLRIANDGPTTELDTTEVPGEMAPEDQSQDTKLILQMLHEHNIDLSTLPYVDSATALQSSKDSDPLPCDVPTSTICDFFPSSEDVQRRLIYFTTNPGTPDLRNLAVSDPENFQWTKKFLRDANDVSRIAKLYLVGVVMYCQLGAEGRGKQICIAPQASLWHRAVAVLGAIFKSDPLAFYNFYNGLSISTLLQPNKQSQNPGNSSGLVLAPPKKKFCTSAARRLPSVLQYNDLVPVYDGRTADFEPSNYEQLPRFYGDVPPSAFTMVIFTANSNKPPASYLADNNMQDYPMFASLNIHAIVYLQEPDSRQKKVTFNYPHDVIGVSFPPSDIDVDVD